MFVHTLNKVLDFKMDIFNAQRIVELEDRERSNLRNVKWVDTNLDNLYLLENLRDLDCSFNKLPDLHGLETLRDLKRLSCAFNKVRDLTPLTLLTDLAVFNCSCNLIRDLTPLRGMHELQELECSQNQIQSLEPLQDMHSLRELICFINQIESLSPLQPLHHLERLYCSFNLLRALDISTLHNLRWLSCADNQIESLDPLRSLTLLERLDCSHNRIGCLEPLRDLVHLQLLYFSGNQVETLAPLQALDQLTCLDASRNLLPTLPLFLTTLRRLNFVNVGGNPLEDVPLQVQNFLRVLAHRGTSNSIYQDGQNVHDSEIQRSANESFSRLFQDRLDIDLTQVENEILERRPHLSESLQELLSHPDIHTTLHVTLRDVLHYVWNRARRDSPVRELFLQELEGVREVCFTGKATRLLNVLSGFHADIRVEISSNAQRNALLLRAIERFNILDDALSFLEREFRERGESEAVIQEWKELLRTNFY